MKNDQMNMLPSAGGFFRRKLAPKALVAVMALGLSISSPAPAQAGCCAGGLYPILGAVLAVVEVVNAFLTMSLTSINDSINTVGAVISSGQSVQMESDARLAQAMTDNATKDAIAASTMPAVIQHTIPPVKEHALHHCKSITENKKPMMMEDHVRALGASIAKGVNLRFRGPGKDGVGGQYDYAERSTRRGENVSGDPLTDHPQLQSATPGVEGPAGVADYDIDIARWDSMPLIVPQMSIVGSTSVSQVSGSGDEKLLQQRWVAARNFCYEIAGRRPSPPTGKQLETPDGMRRMANWNHCAAIQSAFILQCGNYVARFSRFNKTDSPDVYKATTELCETAATEVYESKSKMPKAFHECKYGLSQYEAEYLTLAICAGPKHSTAAAGAGANYPDIMTNNDMCAMRITTWQARNAAERANMLAAVAGIVETQSCWVGTEGTMVREKSSSIEDEGSVMPKKASYRADSQSPASLPRTIAQ